jgi:hypothetical protein
MTDPFRGTRHGSAPAALSVLDSAMTGTGQTARTHLLAPAHESPFVMPPRDRLSTARPSVLRP